MSTGTLTVRELLTLATKAFCNGHADKKVYLATDDEGNHFYPLQYGFTTNEAEVEYMLSNEIYPIEDANNIVILG